MAQRNNRPGPGRTPSITPEQQKKIVDAIRLGNFAKTACAWAGVPYSTFKDWLRLANDAKYTGKNKPIYSAFSASVKAAEVEGEIASLGIIRKAAQGGSEVDTEVIEKFDDQGRLKERRTKKKLTAPSWQAAAWYLERKHPDRWGQIDRIKGAAATEKTDVERPMDRLAAAIEMSTRLIAAQDREAEAETGTEA